MAQDLQWGSRLCTIATFYFTIHPKRNPRPHPAANSPSPWPETRNLRRPLIENQDLHGSPDIPKQAQAPIRNPLNAKAFSLKALESYKVLRGRWASPIALKRIRRFSSGNPMRDSIPRFRGLPGLDLGCGLAGLFIF